MSVRAQILYLAVWNWLGLQIASELNHYLSPLGLALHLDVLWLIFVALNLSRLTGLLYTFLFALLADAHLGGPHGLWVVAYLSLWGIAVSLRHLIQRESPFQVQLVSTIFQGILLLVLAFTLGGGQLATFGYWQRLTSESLLSLGLLWLISAPWYYLQHRLLISLGWDTFAELRPE